MGLESTNEFYAISKIAELNSQAFRKQNNKNFISAMPTNIFGPKDNFNLQNSHVIPGLIHKAHLSKINRESNFVVWGSGDVKREFMYKMI